MRKVLPLLIVGILIHFSTIQHVYAQVMQTEVMFVFDSKDKLVNTVESDTPKEITFAITGIESAGQAKSLKESFTLIPERVVRFRITREHKGVNYTGRLTLTADTKVSHFTKILITCGIRQIIVEGLTIRSEQLNDKSVYNTN